MEVMPSFDFQLMLDQLILNTEQLNVVASILKSINTLLLFIAFELMYLCFKGGAKNWKVW